MSEASGRREVATRKITLFHKLASYLVALNVKPNHVSVMSAWFGIFGGVAFFFATGSEPVIKIALLVAAILFIQLRLVCNLIDGLMAVECGLKTASGELFNDVPDRVSDIAFMVGAGVFALSYSNWMIHVAWAAALGAVLTAYVRCLGAAMTGKHDFIGPMAKQHRMFLLTLGSLGGIVETLIAKPAFSMSLALVLIAVGSFWTAWRRLMRVHAQLD